MKTQSLYRNATWLERALTFFPIQLMLGLLFIGFLPMLYRWGWGFWNHLTLVQSNTLIIVSISFLVVAFALRRLMRYPGEQAASYIFPTILIVASIAAACVLLLRTPYSNTLLLISFGLAVIWFFSGYYLSRNWRTLNLAVVPFGQANTLQSTKTTKLIPLSEPELPPQYIDAVVADLHSENLCPKWERFLAQCTLNRIPVYHVKQIQESLTGRVRIDHLSENEFGRLLPSTFYEIIKRLFDITAAIVLLPFVGPVMLVAAYMIKKDSEGGVLFKQQRMGYRGITFQVYKFRTMYQNIEGKPFTDSDQDPRITKIGKVLRKYRIDELPQLFNVLKGEMSLIGPRPESIELADWYEKEVPFFQYRHVVRPGISGWAQVMHGYAAEVDGMKLKLEYDFYYVKHFSLWLDILIVFKTIKTVLTGFGSR